MWESAALWVEKRWKLWVLVLFSVVSISFCLHFHQSKGIMASMSPHIAAQWMTVGTNLTSFLVSWVPATCKAMGWVMLRIQGAENMSPALPWRILSEDNTHNNIRPKKKRPADPREDFLGGKTSWEDGPSRMIRDGALPPCFKSHLRRSAAVWPRQVTYSFCASMFSSLS